MSISVEDYIAIQRLMYRYARCADKKDYTGFNGVFCDDAVFDFSGTLVTTCSAIQQMMRNLEKFTRTLHQVHNTLYEVDGDTASGETYCIASHLFSEEAGETRIDMGIIYEDRLRRTQDGWRIEFRKFNLVWSQTAPVDKK
ncbi:MAG: nuclear transport factor 2 family protein [Halioglobus sp.]